ncbi:hypothetical protein GO001_09890 [Streptomyces sp. NRRL B-1677]|nr:hypothetical protein [Streptomyces sp. NRRL B-1677]
MMPGALGPAIARKGAWAVDVRRVEVANGGIILKLSRMTAVVAVAAIAPAVLFASPSLADGAAAGSSARSPQASVAESAGQQGEGPADKDQQAEKDRGEIQRIVSTGGPGVKDAGKAALGGGPADMRKFLESGQFEARDEDNQVLVSRIVYHAGGRGVKDAAKAVLKGTPEDRVAFLELGQYVALDSDNQVLVSRVIGSGGRGVREAGKAAMNGTPQDRIAFLASGQYKAQDDDISVLISRLISEGGSAMHDAGRAALKGTPQDRIAFLADGQFEARAKDKKAQK